MESGARRAKICLISTTWGRKTTFSDIIPNCYSLLKLGRNLKTAHRRAEQIENLTFVGLCSIHVGIFYLEHVKIIWGHSVHFSINWALSQKWLIVERN